MDCKLINFIRNRVTTNRWCNGRAGGFDLDSINFYYRFVEVTPNLNCYLYAERERNDENTPIVLKGFIAFLIACWEQNEIVIYNTYNERTKKTFFDIEAKKPGSFKKDLDKEFAKELLRIEQNNIIEFENTFDYISDQEKNLVLEFAKNYLEYTSTIYKEKLKVIKVEKDFENLLHHDRKHALMHVLHELLDNSQGKKVAIVIKALNKLGYLNMPGNRSELYTIMNKTFGNIGTPQNLNTFLKPDSQKIADTELESIIEILRKV